MRGLMAGEGPLTPGHRDWVPPPPPPRSTADSKGLEPARPYWYLAAVVLFTALAVVAARHHGYSSAYEGGRLGGLMTLSLSLATGVRAIYKRTTSRVQEAWHPWAIVLAAGLVLLLGATTWSPWSWGKSPADAATAQFNSQVSSCRSASPSPLSPKGALSFGPVDVGAGASLESSVDQMLPGLQMPFEVRGALESGSEVGRVVVIPGISDPASQAGFLDSVRNVATESGAASQTVSAYGAQITVAQAPTVAVAAAIDGCYGVMVGARDQGTALRVTEEILAPS